MSVPVYGILANTFSLIATFGAIGVATAGGFDAYVARLDRDGNFQWVQRGGGIGTDVAYAVATDAGGNAILAGSSDSALTTFDTFSHTGAGDFDSFVMKFDQQGNLVWSRFSEGSGKEEFRSVAVRQNDVIYAGGSVGGNGVFGASNTTSTGVENILVVRLMPAAPTITTPPLNQSVIMGSNAFFSVVVSGVEPITYQWLLGGTNLASATNATLSLTNVQPGQAGNCLVVVANVGGSVTSAVATLTVLVPPGFSAQPAGQLVGAGGSGTFTAGVTGTGPFTYQWRFNGTNIVGATSASLTITNSTAAQAGRYSLVVSNAVGTATSAAANLLFFGDLKLLASTVLAGPVGQQFRVDYADVITPSTNWLVLTNITLPYSPYVVVDYTSAGKSKRFYRAVPVP